VAQEPASVRYAERLGVPWWLWLMALALAGLLAAEVFLGAPGFATWIPYFVLVPLTGFALWWLGRIRVAVADGEFRVDDARLPVRFISRVGVLDAEAKREALGPRADPYAFVVQRPWVRGAVLVVLDDPTDPTPYWVVSARRPARLAEALLAAVRQAAPAEPPERPEPQEPAAQADRRPAGSGPAPSASG
jgi:Protein of unknown function (DUF3093)